jgi:RNA polymerase sigma-70 factor (ECF subfamily)
MENLDLISDEEIVERVRTTHPELFAIIVKRYQDKLLRYAKNLTGDGDRSIDVVQDSFIKAFVNLKGFDEKKKFSGWIYRIVHNEAINVIKKFKKEIALPEDFDITSEENISEDYSKKETRVMVTSCLDKLPIAYLEPLSLFYIEDKSYEEISDILRIPMGTVATRISRAKKIMRKICQKI